MTDLESLTDDQLHDAIELCYQTGMNFSSHGQADDYVVGSFKLAKRYQEELERRALARKEQTK